MRRRRQWGQLLLPLSAPQQTRRGTGGGRPKARVVGRGNRRETGWHGQKAAATGGTFFSREAGDRVLVFEVLRRQEVGQSGVVLVIGSDSVAGSR